MFVSAFIPFFSSLWINVVLISRDLGKGKKDDMQITLKNLHPATIPGISEGGGGAVAFPSPSLFLAKATDQPQKEVSIDKTV